MAFGSDRSANFVIAAKDAATKPLGNVGKAMGKLQRTGVTAFKAIAAASVAAASALAAFTINAIKGALEDQKAQARLNATLRARGLLTEDNTAKIEKAIAAGQKMAFTDDAVRASIETATQFTSNFSKALKIQRVAQDVAIAKNISLEQATSLVGKAFAGNGKGVKALGIELTKTRTATEKFQKITRNGAFMVEQTKTTTQAVKGQAALNAITEKFGGIAKEVAETPAVRLEAALDALNEKFEAFGAKFIPAVSKALTFFSDEVLPKVGPVLDDLADIFDKIYNESVKPLAKSVGDLFALFESADGKVNLLTIALAPLQLALDGIRLVIDLIVAGLKIIGVGGGFKTQALDRAATAAGYGGGSFVNPMNARGTTTTPSTPIVTNISTYLDGRVVAQNSNTYLGNQTRNLNPQRSFPRNP